MPGKRQIGSKENPMIPGSENMFLKEKKNLTKTSNYFLHASVITWVKTVCGRVSLFLQTTSFPFGNFSKETLTRSFGSSIQSCCEKCARKL